jgi:uncharacterized protein YhdP
MEAADELPSAMSPEILLAMTLVTALPIGIGSIGAYWPNAGTALERRTVTLSMPRPVRLTAIKILFCSRHDRSGDDERPIYLKTS